MTIENRSEIQKLLASAKVIAVVGYSDKPYRTSYRIGQYLRSAGYKVYPVNPTVAEIDGEPSYPDLAAIPDPIDIVDVFRRSEYLSAIVDEAIAVGAKAIWAQLGVVDHNAAQRAEAAGLKVVMDRCIMVDHEQLLG
ncbi:MAG TPA: CoA-binding protein [Anaerolineales bacterium]|nr:CoA-binding protein [Anaerolineales bacterium]